MDKNKIMPLALGDILLMKKSHACGSTADKFEVIRLGSDVKIRCRSCLHEVVVPRVKLERNIKRIISEEQAKE